MLATLAAVLLHASAFQYEGSATLLVAGGELQGGFVGRYEVLSPQLVLAHESGAFVDVTVPLARLELGAYSFSGLGDLTAVAGWQTGGLRLGLATMWPTGDPHQGLGTAHLMLAPRVDARLEHERLRLSATALLRGAIAFGPHGQHQHQSIIAPHDLLDVMALARLGLAPTSWLEVAGVAAPVLTLIAHPVSSPGTRMSFGAEATVRLWLLRATLQALVPVTANRTSSWQVSLNVAVGDARAEVACH